MSVMLAVDEDLAESLRGMLPGEVRHHEPDLLRMPQASMEEEGPRALASAVARQAPQVLVAGVRMGGNAYCGMDGVRLVLRAPRPPAVVLLTPRLTRQLADHGRAIGVYGIIETRAVSLADLIDRVTAAVDCAAFWRDRRS